ncbi:hypothetical protein AOLI_G00230400 [Acnodon oligacanthus]
MQQSPAAVPAAHDGVIFLGAALACLLALLHRLSESLALGEGAKHMNASAGSITSISTAKFRAFSMHIHCRAQQSQLRGELSTTGRVTQSVLQACQDFGKHIRSACRTQIILTVYVSLGRIAVALIGRWLCVGASGAAARPSAISSAVACVCLRSHRRT